MDWLRGVAVLVMVECHVFNAVLAPLYRETPWFAFLNWLNGFVAPACLLVSGGVIGNNLRNRWQDVVTFGKSWRKLWVRIGQIFIVAYLLHLPTPFIWQFFGSRGPHLIALWTKMDIPASPPSDAATKSAISPGMRKKKAARIIAAARQTVITESYRVEAYTVAAAVASTPHSMML